MKVVEPDATDEGPAAENLDAMDTMVVQAPDAAPTPCKHILRSGARAGSECGVVGCRRKAHTPSQAVTTVTCKPVQTRSGRHSMRVLDKYTWANDDKPVATGQEQRAELTVQLRKLRSFMSHLADTDPRRTMAQRMVEVMEGKLAECIDREGRSTKYARRLDESAANIIESEHGTEACLREMRNMRFHMLNSVKMFQTLEQEVEANLTLATAAGRLAVNTGNRLLNFPLALPASSSSTPAIEGTCQAPGCECDECTESVCLPEELGDSCMAGIPPDVVNGTESP